MEKIVIYGNGVLALWAYKLITCHNLFEIQAFCCENEYLTSSELFGIQQLPFENIELLYPPSEYGMFAAIGYKIMRNRKNMFDKAKAKGYTLVNIIGQRALHFNDFEIGENNLIDDGCFIGELGKMGDNNVIRRFASLGHNFEIGNHNFISAGSNFGGFSQIGDSCFIGLGAIAKNGLKIADETLLGLGSVLIKDSEPFSTYVGNPSKKMREHGDTGIII